MDGAFFMKRRIENMIRLEHVSKTFQTKDGEVQAVKMSAYTFKKGKSSASLVFQELEKVP